MDFHKCTNSPAEKKTGLSAPCSSDFAFSLMNCRVPIMRISHQKHNNCYFLSLKEIRGRGQSKRNLKHIKSIYLYNYITINQGLQENLILYKTII